LRSSTPAGDTIPSPIAGQPPPTRLLARAFHTAVWTLSEMIVWAGVRNSGYLNTGGRYCAESGTSTPTPTPTATFTPTPIASATATATATSTPTSTATATATTIPSQPEQQRNSDSNVNAHSNSHAYSYTKHNTESYSSREAAANSGAAPITVASVYSSRC
jgi:hypothetical protein